MQDDYAGWRSLNTILLQNTTSVQFDPASELLWLGSLSGHVESLFPTSLTRYTAYTAHRPAPVKQLVVDEKAIYSLGHDRIKCANRRGIAAWNLSKNVSHLGAQFTAMQFASSRASDLVIASASTTDLGQELLSVNPSTGTILRRVSRTCPVSLKGWKWKKLQTGRFGWTYITFSKDGSISRFWLPRRVHQYQRP